MGQGGCVSVVHYVVGNRGRVISGPAYVDTTGTLLILAVNVRAVAPYGKTPSVYIVTNGLGMMTGMSGTLHALEKEANLFKDDLKAIRANFNVVALLCRPNSPLGCAFAAPFVKGGRQTWSGKRGDFYLGHALSGFFGESLTPAVEQSTRPCA